MLNPVDPAPQKVLGIPWNINKDSLVMRIDEVIANATLTVTKRVLLKVVASIFDPLGVLSP